MACAKDTMRQAHDNESRARVLEIFDEATRSEPFSLHVWLSYCDYFWSLYTGCMNGPVAGWTRKDQMEGRELFTINDALSLWNKGYDAVKYRIGDSHVLWDRWISLELEQLSRTRTPEGVRRITHLFRLRLQTPHQTWENTSSMFSTFLSQYSKSAWEEQMADATRISQPAKKLYEPRADFEFKLAQAERANNLDTYRTVMKAYLGWEIANCRKDRANRSTCVDICLGLFGRALSGIFSTDESIWTDYLVFLSTLQAESKSPVEGAPTQLEASRRAVTHCSWSGALWARCILNGEEAGLSFSEMEKIKHSATMSKLGRDGMSGVVEMYSAWCGYLKRAAMHPRATDEAVELADMGLPSAIEDVQMWGARLFKDFQGDPNFRLEKIYIQYLTEKDGDIEQARKFWLTLAQKNLYANSYNFWMHFYLWEMLVFTSSGSRRSPTPSGAAPKTIKIPVLATEILERAVTVPDIDWPERVMEIYVQHCNDYETPCNVRKATDLVHRVQKRVMKRREAEQLQAQQVQQAWQAQQLERLSRSSQEVDSPSGSAKRKREISPAQVESNSKRQKNETIPPAHSTITTSLHPNPNQNQQLKRDREHTSVLVTGLPPEATLTQVKKFFGEFGHINHLTVRPEKDSESSVALIEFRSVEEAQSALIRKFYDRTPIDVSPATDLTIFVTNFPPNADDNFMHSLFKDCGEIFGIRWPSLKYNTHRRFCYVSFRTHTAAAKATQLDGKILEGRYRLEAKYSDPANRKAREGAVAEGREVHVSSLDQNLSEIDIRDIFARYGEVESVKLLRNKEGKSRGSGFVVFANKEQGEEAVRNLDKVRVGKAVMNVEVSVHKNYKPVSKVTRERSGTPTNHMGENTERNLKMGDVRPYTGADDHTKETIALLGLPDTVNDTRVRELVAPHGEVVKIVLRHDRGGALVEFAEAASAGKAMLALEGFEVQGSKLRTGPARELFKGARGATPVESTGNQKVVGPAKENSKTLMVPPASAIRRPTIALGKSKPRRGLGFIPVNKKSGDDKCDEAIAKTADGNGGKSNADFKAIFLASQNGVTR